MKKLIQLGISGDKGSFSEQAGLVYAQNNRINPDFNYLIDMDGVLAAIEKKVIDIGILPVVNLQGGLVRMAFEAMGKHTFKFVDYFSLNISQCLLVKPNVKQDKIKNIVSYTQAIVQCKNYLSKNFSQARLIEWQDTALAAKDLSQNKLDSETAVIAPLHAANLYNLDVLAENIQDMNPNLTTFIVVEQLNL